MGPRQLRLRRRLTAAGLGLVLCLSGAVTGSSCGRGGGNDTNPKQDEKRESGAPVQAVASRPASSTERAAASRAIGTRNGEHDT